MFSRFDKAHIAGLSTMLVTALSTFIPDMPAEVVAGAGALFSWLLTYAVPNKA